MGIIIRKGLKEQVYLELHEMIENSRFTPGAKIIVEQLAEEMGVSRTPVWQAISTLEKEGLVVTLPNKGVYMKMLSPKESIELYSVRGVLESYAAMLATNNIEQEVINELSTNLVLQQEAIENTDLKAYSKLDFIFHSEICKCSKNDFLIEMLKDIKKKMRPLVNDLNIILPELLEDHKAMLVALQERDSEKAALCFVEHNDRMKNHIKMLNNLV